MCFSDAAPSEAHAPEERKEVIARTVLLRFPADVVRTRSVLSDVARPDTLSTVRASLLLGLSFLLCRDNRVDERLKSDQFYVSLSIEERANE